MISLTLYFPDVPQLQEFLEKFPDSKRYLEFKEGVDYARDHKGWTEFEDDVIVRNYSHRSAQNIANDLQIY